MAGKHGVTCSMQASMSSAKGEQARRRRGGEDIGRTCSDHLRSVGSSQTRSVPEVCATQAPRKLALP
jgi:hypothetical protein